MVKHAYLFLEKWTVNLLKMLQNVFTAVCSLLRVRYFRQINVAVESVKKVLLQNRGIINRKYPLD